MAKITPDYLWTAVGCPIPVREYRFAPPRKWRFDYAWVAEKVALEIEGGLWIQGRHNRAPGMIKDMEKYNTATFMGWRVFRFVPQELKNAKAQMFIKLFLDGGQRRVYS